MREKVIYIERKTRFILNYSVFVVYLQHGNERQDHRAVFAL